MIVGSGGMMVVDGVRIEVEAAVSNTLPKSVLLETDVSQLPALLGQMVPTQSGESLVVMTRARTRNL